MDNATVKEYREIKRAGWNVEKTPQIAMNDGSETPAHLHAKTAVAYVARDYGYQVSTEVGHDQYGEIDVLAYHPDRINWAIEVETDPDKESIQDKLERYVESNDVIDDMQVITVGELPANLLDLHDRIRTELGFF